MFMFIHFHFILSHVSLYKITTTNIYILFIITSTLLEKMALRLCPPLRYQFHSLPNYSKPIRFSKLSVHCTSLDPIETKKLVTDVKEKLQKQQHNLPLGRNGRDDEDMILWYLKDRNFCVNDAVTKLAKAIYWRQEFRVSELTEESVKSVAETGKAYIHNFLDVSGRPVLIVVPSKHKAAKQDALENEKLCVFLVEKALSKLPAGKEQILGIFDLRGFGTENADIKFLTFLFEVFYNYYPKRLGQVLFVEAPFVFKPIWQLAKPLVKSYASLVRFCSVDDVKKEYFTESTLPDIFRH